ncbi:MAG: Crp/Fnr family transcriptional regulator [Candidatus Tectomicrobia bacterium]|uniref:Crp/Fnr family transcriptional regulator n=1 Tax=Tectimicrobiota bacterium TaxID=2528274 RepID=A0A932CNX0_UNCTE|nr:Crp/Fnr family transcriptional regulator [Candidatus Tectomicrobia bacterium]
MEDEIFKALKACPLYQGLQEEQLKKIREVAHVKEFTRDALIFSEGEECRGFYLVVSGLVKIYKLSPEGREHILHQVRSGHSFAEAAMFAQQRYPASARAVARSRLLFFPKSLFLGLLRGNPELCFNIMGSMATYLRLLVSSIESLTLKSASARVSGYLLSLVPPEKRFPPTGSSIPLEVELPSKKHLIAKSLGISAETFSRVLKELQEKDLLVVRQSKILIRDIPQLQAQASSALG